jgi:pantetheine-phosphate adenylyltransferase
MRNAILDTYPGDISDDEWKLISIAIDLHDIVYEPRSDHNEFDSCAFINEYSELSYGDKVIITDAIMNTSPTTYGKKVSKISEIIRYGDLYAFITGNVGKLFENYRKLIKEFQFVPYEEFYKAHRDFIVNNIEANCDNLKINSSTIISYLSVIDNYCPNIGVYAGTFNPFHIGHLSVLEQAEKVFDKVIIATPKEDRLSRFKSLNKILPLHEIIEFDGLLVDLLNKLSKQSNITLIRGLRNGNDLEYEVNMKRINEDFDNKIETVYFVTNLPHISSSVIRGLPGESYSQYIPTKYDYLYKSNKPINI